MAAFTRSEIEEGLKRLGELAQIKGFHIQLTLVGGAVMVLRFNARQSTRDIYAVILEPREARLVRELARSVADEFNWTIEPFLVKGDELTAQYAFWDLWESLYGTD